jgi:putative transposase
LQSNRPGVSITMQADFCVEALEDALAKYGRPEIFNTDQGSQFTSEAFTGVLIANKIAISMDGKGAWRDNVFVERLWKSVKYEEVYLHAYDSVGAAGTSLGRYLNFYNRRSARSTGNSGSHGHRHARRAVIVTFANSTCQPHPLGAGV